MIEFSCKKCGQRLKVEDKHSGKRIRCPKCGEVGVVHGNSDKIKFHCESCGQSISVPKIHTGKKGKCPKCKNPIVVPSLKKEPAESVGAFTVLCSMCEGIIEVPETSRGQTIECPQCGSYVEASSGGWSPESSESDTLIPSNRDEDQYEENSEEPTKGVGVDRRLIFMIFGVAAVVVLGLIILVTVILPSGSHLVEGPESRREREEVVEADLGRQPVISDTQPKEPIVEELQKEERLPAVQYELKLEKGQSYYVRVISGANAVQEVTDQEIINETTSGFGYSFDVSEVDEERNGWVDCTVDWVMFRQKSPSIEITYDSSKKPSRVPTLGQKHAGFLGESFSVKMTPQGQVKELRGLEKLRKNMEKKIREERMKQQIMQTLEEQQLADLIKDAMLSPMAVYPDEPVVIGDSWSRTDFLSSRQPFIYEHQWTLKDRKAGTAIIEASAVITSRPDALGRRRC